MKPEDAARVDHQDLYASLWAETAIPAPATPALTQSMRADVAIVGAGYAGLSAALHLAEAGVKVVVLEAKEPGWGASGRNGGQVIAGLKYEPDTLVSLFGADVGERMAGLSSIAPDYLFNLVRKHDIQCDAKESGWIQPAFRERGLRLAETRVAQWSRRGVKAEFLSKARVNELTGTEGLYEGGWLDPRGGSVQPLSLARGLALAAQKAGATVHGQSPVTALQRNGAGWVLTTQSGATVTADTAILCTNGYTDDLWPGLRRSVVPVRPFQVATAPLSENLRRTVYPHGHVGSDTKRMLSYYRLDPHGRLIMGGRGAVDHARHPEVHAALRRDVIRFFPQLGEPKWEYAWSGWIAMTHDHLPHMHELAPRLHTVLGCQGRGVALMVTFGRELARRALDSRHEGWPTQAMRPLPFHALRRPVLAGIRTYWRWRDSMDRPSRGAA